MPREVSLLYIYCSKLSSSAATTSSLYCRRLCSVFIVILCSATHAADALPSIELCETNINCHKWKCSGTEFIICRYCELGKVFVGGRALNQVQVTRLTFVVMEKWHYTKCAQITDRNRFISIRKEWR